LSEELLLFADPASSKKWGIDVAGAAAAAAVIVAAAVFVGEETRGRIPGTASGHSFSGTAREFEPPRRCGRHPSGTA